MGRSSRPWLAVLLPFAFSLSAAVLCRLTLGQTLGLFFGGILFATLLAPPLVVAERSLASQALAAGSTVVGIAAVWSAAVFDRVVTFPQWLACSSALAAYVLALAGLVALLRAARVGPVLCSAVVVVLALAWLSWPVWLSQWYDRVAAGWLVPAHPLFAVNGVLIRQFGPWGESPMAYASLMNLQDVAYVMPGSVVPSVLSHATIGAAALLLGWRIARRAPEPRSGERQ